MLLLLDGVVSGAMFGAGGSEGIKKCHIKTIKVVKETLVQ